MAEKNKIDITENISFSASCGNCGYLNIVNMPYSHAAKLFNGQPLNYVCTKCNASNGFDLKNIKHIINDLPLKKRNHFFDYLSEHKKNYISENKTESPFDGWIGVIIVLAIVIGVFWVLSHSGLEEHNGGMTNNYVCAYEANKLADESKELVQKMTDMRCTGIVTSDALYARCMELKAENDKKIRDWKALSCTDDSKLP
ncbi:MAG: hypothetical protein HGA85_08465 [Nanoarchaeota archaeon]|nr:hypothetical protein [Nanoarchaeota archaeon]